MDLSQATRELFDRSFLLGGIRQRRALKYLAECPDQRAVDLLVEALVKGHPRSDSIRSILLSLTPQADQPKIDRLWQSWLTDRQERLGKLLVDLDVPAVADDARVPSLWKLGRAAVIAATPPAVRQVLSLLQDKDADIRSRVVPALAQVPNEATLNEEIIGFWLQHPSPELDAFITKHSRAPRQGMVDELWRRWLKEREERLGKLLVQLGLPAATTDARVPCLWKLGRPVSLEPEQKFVRAELRWVTDPDADIRNGLLRTVAALPNDEQLNNEIVEAWAKHESSELEKLIAKQGRKPARSELEALFYLVTGQAKAYQALQDEHGECFLQAFLMASATFRQRINDTVVRSENARLVEIYNRAMAGREGFDRQVYLEALKKVGDEDRLFESLREMKLIQALELCQRWAESGELPKNDRRRQAAARAVNAYRGLAQATVEEGPTPPGGLRDLFDVWKQQSVSDDQRRQDARAADPLLRARALYLAQVGAGENGSQGHQAATSDDWPVRLVARLLNPALAAAEDHVQWVGALSGMDADVLESPLAGTPVDYARFSDRLAQARQGGPAAARSARFLEILCAFQGAFVSGDITLEATREATDARAIDAGEDAPLE